MNFRNMGSEGKDIRQTAAAMEAMPGSPPLARQSSIYSLTFDEFQSTLGGIGKDFGSMNMDEFLRNIWSAEESQAVASAFGTVEPAGSSLQRQGSLTLPRTLSQKTVDEVWKNLIIEGPGGPGTTSGGGGGCGPDLHPRQQQRQPTLGEMTLEEFLVRAGVVREDINQSIPVQRQVVNESNQGNNNNSMFFGELPVSNNNNNTAGIALGFGNAGRNAGALMHGSMANNSAPSLAMTANGTRPYGAPMPLGNNVMQVGNNVDLGNQQGMRGGGIMGIGDPTMNNGLIPGVVGLGGGGVTVAAAVGSPANQMSSDGLGKGNGDLSSLSPVPYVFNGGLRGRKCSGAVEKVVERRQRRMIKNRESAARSRARKQAYTMELEAEVAKLKEQNQELQKKQEEIMEMQKNQVLEVINQQRGPKKRCLRRTQTGPW